MNSPKAISQHSSLAAACGLLVLTALVMPPRARADDMVADGAAIEACLALVKKNQDAQGPHDPDELTEKAGPEGRLNAARDAAPKQRESCIGVVETACIQAESIMSDAAIIGCYDREAAVWDARLNAAYKELLASAEDKGVADGYRKIQRSWITFRDASCEQNYTVFKGTMANPMIAYCRLNMTARQAIGLEGWEHGPGQ